MDRQSFWMLSFAPLLLKSGGFIPFFFFLTAITRPSPAKAEGKGTPADLSKHDWEAIIFYPAAWHLKAGLRGLN